MLFNSVEFVVLLGSTFLLYVWVPSQRARLWILLLGSWIFYAYWEPSLILLLLGSIAVNYVIGASPFVRKRIGIALAAFVNLGLLAYFKYTNFVISVFSDIAQLLGCGPNEARFTIVLPIGISFITFQLLAYIVDIHRGTIDKERSFLKFAAFISFFPHLIAGPICRSHQLLPQLYRLSRPTYAQFAQGLLMLGVGLMLKAGIADNLAPYVNTNFGKAGEMGPVQALLSTVGFGVQILCDFWGYSTMALGAAFLFGIVLPSNFDLPYLATSLQSFWRRWHITLSFWLRDYLYFPLGGNQLGRARTYLNLLIVMTLGGLWHGASYNFLAWGVIHGVGLGIERALGPAVSYIFPKTAIVRVTLGWLYTMLIVFAAWIFFRAPDIPSALSIFASIHDLAVTPGSLSRTDWFALFFIGLFVLVMLPLHGLNSAGQNMNFYRDPDLADHPPQPLSGGPQIRAASIVLPSTVKIAVAFWLMVAGIVLGAEDVVPFIYFQF